MVAPGVVSSAPDPDLARGGQVLLLLTNVGSWVRRRVETVRFTEEGLVRRFVSLDFSVDGSWPKVAPSGDGSDGVEAGGPASMLVPLALLRKEPLALLDVIDETGATLPVLGTYENGFLAYSALCAVATIVRGNDEPLPADLQSTLYAVAMQPESLALAALDDLKRSPDGSSGKIARDQIFLKLATDLCRNFILLAEVKHAEERSTARRIIKFSYTTSPIRTARRRPKQWLVRPHEQRFDFDLPSVGDAESHHFQLVPPAGIEVSRCRLRLKPQFLDESTRLGSKVGGTAHLHATRAGSGSSAVAEIELSPSGHGPVLAATVASGVVLLVTLAYLGFVLGPTPDQNADGGRPGKRCSPRFRGLRPASWRIKASTDS